MALSISCHRKRPILERILVNSMLKTKFSKLRNVSLSSRNIAKEIQTAYLRKRRVLFI